MLGFGAKIILLMFRVLYEREDFHTCLLKGNVSVTSISEGREAGGEKLRPQRNSAGSQEPVSDVSDTEAYALSSFLSAATQTPPQQACTMITHSPRAHRAH